MLNKISYHNTSDLYYTKFLSMQQGTLIVSGPDVADLWREQLHLAKIDLVTLTYADWVKSLKETYLEDKIDILKKTDLWDLFHRIWHTCNGPNNYLQFQKAFDLYTDLKSYTEDLDIVRQIFNLETTLNDQVKNAIVSLYGLEEIVDEYKILRLLINKVNHQEKKIPNFHLIGFKVFSTVQLNLIDALSTVTDVNIYISKYLEDKTQANQLSDWPKWLKEDRHIEIEKTNIRKKNFLTLCERGDYPNIWKNCLGSTATLIMIDQELPLISYGQQALPNSIQSPAEAGHFGISSILKKIHEKMLESEYTWEDISIFIEEGYKTSLETKNNYGELKWLQYINKWFRLKSSYIKSKSLFTWLDYNVLEEKMKLDAVRLNWVQNANSDSKININSLDKQIYFFPKDKNYLIVDTSANIGSAIEKKYSQVTIDILKSLGPMLSEEWHRVVLENQIFDFLGQSEETHLFLAREALEVETFWKNLIKNNVFKLITPILDSPKTKISEAKEKKSLKLEIYNTSPSALLTYKNCPRQYWANYIEKLQLQEDEQVIVTESKKGEIYHQILQFIGDDFNLCNKFSNSKEDLKNYLILNNRELLESNAMLLEEMTQILMHSLKSWVLMPLWQSKWTINWELPFLIEELSMKGRIDFVAYQEETEQLIIIDFKKSSVPTISEIIRFDHWQISCYICAWKKLNPNKNITGMIFGYWNLTCSEDSSFLQIGNINTTFPLSTTTFKDDYSIWELSFKEMWQVSLASLRNEEKFPAKPIRSQICTYCSLNNYCSKGDL